MKIGLLCCFYGNDKYLNKVMAPWITLKEKGKIDLITSVVHGQFKEYHDLGYIDDDKATVNWINDNSNIFNYIYFQKEGVYESEAQIRNYALKYLLDQNVDVILLLDNDEVYQENDILKMINYVENEPFITWFRIEFKNLVFSENTYIEGFRPPRVFKIKCGDYKLNHFYWDNDPIYIRKINDLNIEEKTYENFTSLNIPKSIINPLHYTWLNDEISKKKVEYQTFRWNPPKGFGCSFKWTNNGLEFNENYYKLSKLPYPILKNIA